MVNAETNLRQIPDESADFVLSLIALQHTATPFQRQYVGEFIRILKPGGVAYFQVIQATFLRNLVPDFLVDKYRHWKHRGKPFISMFGLAESEVNRIVAAHGGLVLDHQLQAYGGSQSRWSSHHWCVRKR